MYVQFGPWASFFLVSFAVLFMGITVALFAGIAFALRKLTEQVDRLTNMAEPLVAKASNTLDTVQRITVNVGEKADSILAKGEVMTDDLAEKVGRTSTVVQKSVTSPLIGLSSLISGLSAGVSTWSRAAKDNAKAGGPVSHTPPHRNGAGTVDTVERVTITPDGR
jgi:uncharacterized protein YoxC